MRWTVAAVLAAGLLTPAGAQAGTYDVVACNAPGASGVNHAWRGAATSYSNAPQPESYDVFDDCRGGEKGLVARSKAGGSGRAGFLTGAAWEFDAPAGTVISRITVWRFGFKFRTNSEDPSGPGDPTRAIPGSWVRRRPTATPSVGAFGETCKNPVGQPVCGFGSDGGLVGGQRAQLRRLDAQAQLGGGLRRARGLRPLLRRRHDPLLARRRRALRRPRHADRRQRAVACRLPGRRSRAAGTAPASRSSVDASDNSGIRNARAEAGGAGTARTRARATSRAPCRARTSRAGRSSCPRAPDGEHAVRIVAEDAAGNAATAERSVLIDGTPPQARLERAARADAAREGRRRRLRRRGRGDPRPAGRRARRRR